MQLADETMEQAFHSLSGTFVHEYVRRGQRLLAVHIADAELGQQMRLSSIGFLPLKIRMLTTVSDTHASGIGSVSRSTRKALKRCRSCS